jgi:hypothetical protein
MMDAPPEPPPAQEQVIERKLLDCGLKAGGFTVRYEDELDGFEVVIASSAGATSAQFRCIFDATYPEIVRFDDLAVEEQYNAFVDDKVRPQVLADLERELRIVGLWEGFPERRAFTTLQDYVRALEAHAGFSRGTMLRAEADTRVIVDFMDPNLLVQRDYERLATLLVVLKFASARDRFSIGFIGNEKVAE